ncbi:response regulator [Salinisphaera sp. T31B1]|uniref:response regulator transcription factor n=1 Tax=Salinisphaera sp. T31B1 TaxID=727963 RepID=UPI00333F0816
MAEQVFVIDDDDAIRETLKVIVAGAGYRVRCFSSAERFLDEPRAAQRGCAIVDMNLPGISGLELQKRISSAGLDLRTVFLTGYGTIALAVEAMRLGATSFLMKPAEPDRLLGELEQCVGSRSTRDERREQAIAYAQQLRCLTPREAEVVSGLVVGLSTRHVASALGISKRTAESHRANLMEKLGIRSVATLTRMALLARPYHSLPVFREVGRCS